MAHEIKEIKLADLGYDGYFDLQWKSSEFTNFSAARVTAEHREAYKVKDTDGEYLARITGKQMFGAAKRADFPAVGDWVAITRLDNERAVIRDILQRKTVLRKKYSDRHDTQLIATNIDVAFIVESLDRDYNLERFERYFVLVSEGGIKPAIILNKVDLIAEAGQHQRVAQIKSRLGNVDIVLTSTITEQGLHGLTEYITRGKTY